jgi:hypothetical protein
MTINKYIFLLIFLNIIVFFSYAQEYSVKGRVIDSDTKKPLAFVNIVINNENQGGTTDIDGKFYLSSYKKIELLKLSYVGYNSLTFPVKDASKNLLIKLKQKQVELSEVIIVPGENPANGIINKTVKNRDINNPEKVHSFTYTSYNKMIFTSDMQPITKKDSSETDSVYIKTKKFFDKQHLLLIESVSKRKFLYPDKNNEKVIASRVSGLKSPLFTLLATQMQSFSFYNEYMNVLDKKYLNPVSKGSINKYFFLIEDTTYRDKDTVFIISFRPRKNKNFDGLKGVLYINTNKYAIQNVIAEPALKQSGIGIKIQQKYEFVAHKQWFPVQLNTDLIFNNVAVNRFKLIGKGRSYIKDIVIDPELLKKEFDNTIVEMEPDATKKSEDYWNKYRVDTLTAKELETYHVIDSIGKAAKLDKKIKGLQTFMTGRIPFRYVDFDIDKILNYNEYEGFRLGIGIHTNKDISKFFSIGGYYAYGFKDQQNKYGGDINFLINKNSELNLKISYINDIDESGSVKFFDSKYLTNDMFRMYLIRQEDKIEQKKVSLGFRTLQYLKVNISLNQDAKNVTNNYQYGTKKDNVSVLLNEFNFTELCFGFRYAYKEKFLKMPQGKISFGTKYPVLWMQYTKGFNNLLYGEYNYNRIDVKVKKSFYIKNLGKSSFQLFAGFIDGDLPYSNLYNGKGSYRIFTIYAPNSFSTMRMNEFLSDRYVSLYYEHSFGKLLFKIKKFEPEIAVAVNVGFGSLSNKEKHFNISVNTMEKGYYESGLLINNLFNMGLYNIGVGVFYRYGPYALSETKDNFAYKVTVVFPF